jgi:hypothetical protein
VAASPGRIRRLWSEGPVAVAEPDRDHVTAAGGGGDVHVPVALEVTNVEVAATVAAAHSDRVTEAAAALPEQYGGVTSAEAGGEDVDDPVPVDVTGRDSES